MNTFDTKMTAVADEVRRLANVSGSLTLDDIAENLEKVELGGGGIDTSDATAATTDILSGKTAYVNGEKITGTIETKEQATPTITVNSNGLITATATQDEGYVTAGSKSTTQQLAFQAAKTITPSATAQVAVPSGYYTGGDITVEGDSNLVAENIVSGKSIFGVVGNATTGGSDGNDSINDGIVDGTITNYSSNNILTIKSYIFMGCINLTNVNSPNVTKIGSCAFSGCTNLASISLTNVTTIGSYAFNGCTSLTSINLPNLSFIERAVFSKCTNLKTASFSMATGIGSYAFAGCTSLTSLSFPNVTTINSNVFRGCTSLTSISFPAMSQIFMAAFASCTNLSIIYLLGSSVCTLIGSNAFSNTGIWSNKGSIFVPSSLVTSYKTATNWTYFSKRIFGI